MGHAVIFHKLPMNFSWNKMFLLETLDAMMMKIVDKWLGRGIISI